MVGDEVPVGGGAFASVEGDPRVFLLGSFGKGNIDKKAADLRDKRLLRFAPETLARLTLAGKGPAIELFKKGEGEWQITAAENPPRRHLGDRGAGSQTRRSQARSRTHRRTGRGPAKAVRQRLASCPR